MLKIVIVVPLLILIWILLLYNRLIVLRNRVRNQFSQMDILLKQRHDMLPNLVDVVKSYATYESETLEKIVRMRSQNNDSMHISEKVETEESITASIGKIFALSESYPELKSNEGYLKLQTQLIEIEDKILFSRQFFNDTVQMYNDKLLIFPNNVVARLFRFEKESYFQIDDSERKKTNINL